MEESLCNKRHGVAILTSTWLSNYADQFVHLITHEMFNLIWVVDALDINQFSMAAAAVNVNPSRSNVCIRLDQ
jgi:hypothetical protein